MNSFSNILVTGSKGQLGTSLQAAIEEEGYDATKFHFTDVDELDICDATSVNRYCDENRIDAIVNLAAYTQVDKAENDIEKAFAINAEAVGNLARAAKRRDCFMIQISTDYVFNGSASTPYLADQPTAPISVYGKSKAEGERQVIDNVKRAAIIRTAWLYSPYGNNFFKTMMRLGMEKPELSVVNDQIGCPTYAPDLAKAILTILTQNEKLTGAEIFHYTNEGQISWYDFAKKIMELGGRKCIVRPISTKEYPTPTRRPAYSVLDLGKIKNTFGITIPDWIDSLKQCINTFETL